MVHSETSGKSGGVSGNLDDFLATVKGHTQVDCFFFHEACVAVAKAFGSSGFELPREKRMEQLIDAVGGPTKAALELKVSRATIYTWTKPDARLPMDEMLALARLGGVSLDWIATGYDRRPDMGAPLVTSGMTVIYRYEASPSGQLFEIVDHGGDIAFRDEWLSRIGIRRGQAGLMIVRGDAMAPTIRDGATLIVDRSVTTIAEAGLFVLVLGREVSVRRAQILRDGSVKLSADNTHYEPEVVAASEVAELRVAGRVKGLVSPL